MINMANVEINDDPNKNKIIEFLKSYQKIIIFVAFLLSILIPLSSERRNDLVTLTERSIDQWVEALNTLYKNFLTIFIQTINEGIDRTINFFQNLVDFYVGLTQLDFTVITNSGFILTATYLLIPILIIYVFYRSFSIIRKRLSDDGSNSTILGIFSPKNLIVLLLFIPFTDGVLWIGAGLAIIVLLYWYLENLQNKKSSNRNFSLLELISWKKIVLLILGIILLLLSVVSHFANEDYSLESLFGLTPTSIMLIFLFILIGLAFLWLIVQSSISDKSITDIIKLKYKENSDSKRILYIIFFITLVIPFVDALIIQSSISSLTLVALNLPWLFGLLLHDAMELFLIFVTLVKDSFDVIINASREIFNGIIPFTPNAVSLLGVLQSTLWIGLLLFIGFLIFYLFLIIYNDKSFQNEHIQRRFFLYSRKYSKFVWGIIFTFLIFLFAFLFDAKNFETIFANKFEIETDSFSSFVVYGIIVAVLIVMILAVYWGNIQIKKGRSARIILNTILVNGLVVIIAIIMIVPFIWMLKNSFQTNAQNTIDFLQQGLIPDPFTTKNYAQLFGIVDVPYETLEYRVITWLFNSFIAAVFVTMFLVFFSAMAGYVLAKRDFIGRRFLFTITIAIMMVPPYVQVIPLYLELNRLGFVGSLLGVIFPFLIQPFSIFLATEFMRGIPDDYLDAARVDGYSEFQIFRKIVLPLSIPVMSVMIIINLIANWNSFMWPLLILEQSEFAPVLRTLPLGIYKINAELQEQMGVILALATLIVLPIFIILFLAQDYIKKGVTVEGLKG
jgi:multiple sugar transport system permease protein